MRTHSYQECGSLNTEHETLTPLVALPHLRFTLQQSTPSWRATSDCMKSLKSLKGLKFEKFRVLQSFIFCLGSWFFALCSMLNALCSMLNALCSMLFAFCSLLFAVRSAGWVPRFPYRELMAQNKRTKPQNVRSTFERFPLDY